jgi:hypothetical protein
MWINRSNQPPSPLFSLFLFCMFVCVWALLADRQLAGSEASSKHSVIKKQKKEERSRKKGIL